MLTGRHPAARAPSVAHALRRRWWLRATAPVAIAVVVAGLSLSAATAQAVAAARDVAAAPAPIPITSSQCPSDISEGEVNGCVTELQMLLNDNGAQLTVDGDFGPATLAAVESYQRSHGLSVDGIVGPMTKESLTYHNGSAPPPVDIGSSACPADISEGQLSGCVTDLQDLLNANGASLTVDGDFGPATLAAVEAYQRAHGLSVDGIVGPETKAALLGGTGPSPIPLTSSSCPADLYEGMINGCVTELQVLLNQKDGAGLTEDGDFGPLTLAAVEHYQGTHGLSVDGIVGPLTKASLTGSSGGGVPAPISITSSSCPADISEGEDDGCVTELQELLNSHGAGLTVDGDFGPATLAAVEAYQSDHGLSVDGIVGPATKASLTGSSGGGGGNPPPPNGSTMQKVVAYAQDIEAGDAEPGWGGGKIWYIWGGGHGASPGPSVGTCAGDPESWVCLPIGDPPQHQSNVGLDCSGFARWVYSLAYGRDVLGSGSTNNQIAEMQQVSSPTPGDLVFFGVSASDTDHVGVYIGNGEMINAPETGDQVDTVPVSDGPDSFLGYYQY